MEPWNAHDILVLPEVGGAPIGGASLEAADFVAALGFTLAWPAAAKPAGAEAAA